MPKTICFAQINYSIDQWGPMPWIMSPHPPDDAKPVGYTGCFHGGPFSKPCTSRQGL